MSSVTRNNDGTVEFMACGMTWLLLPAGLLIRNGDGTEEPMNFDYADLLETEKGRALLAEAILALDHPIQWKNVAVDIPPEHRATPKGNQK